MAQPVWYSCVELHSLPTAPIPTHVRGQTAGVRLLQLSDGRAEVEQHARHLLLLRARLERRVAPAALRNLTELRRRALDDAAARLLVVVRDPVPVLERLARVGDRAERRLALGSIAPCSSKTRSARSRSVRSSARRATSCA